MSHCWKCGKETPPYVAFCSIECKDEYRNPLNEDQKREQKEIKDDMQNRFRYERR